MASRPVCASASAAPSLGLAVGDALGAPAEFLTADQVVERWGVLTEMVGGGCYGVQPGETTDATEMMLCLAESLDRRHGFRPDDIMRRYLAWFDAQPRDVSLTVRTVLLAIHSGSAWDIASRRAYEILGRPTAGNGSLMRCAPVALRFFADPDKRRDAALRESTLTHFDPSRAGRAPPSSSCWWRRWRGICATSAGHRRHLCEEDAQVTEALLSCGQCRTGGNPQLGLGSGLAQDRPLGHAAHQSFEDAVCTTVNLGDDADTNGAVTGALAGAAYGAAAIPARWTAALLAREHVLEVADHLASLAGIAGCSPLFAGGPGAT